MTMDSAILCYEIPTFEIALSRVQDASLRHRPVAIAAARSRAPLLEVSPEAAADGLVPGMTRDVAKRVCPSLVLLSPNPHRVQAGHEQVLGVVQRYAPLWEPVGPGHWFLDVTGTGKLFGWAVDTAARIEREVVQRHGLRGVMGVGTNKLVSQLAAEFVEPVQLYDVRPGGEAYFVRPLSVTHLPLQGNPAERAVRRWFQDLNLQTFGDVADVPIALLDLVAGALAPTLHQWAQGHDPTPVRPIRAQPSLQQEAVVSPPTLAFDVLEGLLHGLMEALCRELRARASGCRHLTIVIQYADGDCAHRHARLPRPTCWEHALWGLLQPLLLKVAHRRVRVTRLALRAEALEPIVEQLDLFAAEAREARTHGKKTRLTTALDQIRTRFGSGSIRYGRTATRPHPA